MVQEMFPSSGERDVMVLLGNELIHSTFRIRISWRQEYATSQEIKLEIHRFRSTGRASYDRIFSRKKSYFGDILHSGPGD